MALAKASLPKVNRCNQRTRIRPRDLIGNAATNVVLQSTGSPRLYNGAVLANNVTFAQDSHGRPKLQKFLDIGLIKVAT